MIYCTECGNDDRQQIAYIQTNAVFDEWRCKACGHEFQANEDAPTGERMRMMDEMSDRELDVEICRKVMGWPEWDGEDDYDGPYPMFTDWDETGTKACGIYEDENWTRWFSPSTSIADAWAVVEKMTLPHIKEIKRGVWWANFTVKPLTTVSATAPTAPRAICLAAIKAVGVK